MFLTSLLLPVTDSMAGWEAAEMVFLRQFEHQESDDLFTLLWVHAYCFLISVTNVLLAFAPVVAWRPRLGKGKWCGTLLAHGAVAALQPPPLGVAYCFWCSSMLILLCAFRIGRPILVAMLTSAIFWVFITRWVGT